MPAYGALAPRPRGLTHLTQDNSPFRRGSQYTSIRFTETAALEGLVASIGSVGGAYDNAPAETVMGLFKNDAIAKGSPFIAGPLKAITDVEETTIDWVHWYTNQRLHALSATFRPKNTNAATMLKITAHQPVTPPTKRRHGTRSVN